MTQDHSHYPREELLPWLVMWMDTDLKYAEWRIRRAFERAPWMWRDIGADLTAAWQERFPNRAFPWTPPKDAA